jgi:hypothetical protein
MGAAQLREQDRERCMGEKQDWEGSRYRATEKGRGRRAAKAAKRM